LEFASLPSPVRGRLFGAVHSVLLGGAQHELAEYYLSVRGVLARPVDDGAAML
jgi:hypothetical protein